MEDKKNIINLSFMNKESEVINNGDRIILEILKHDLNKDVYYGDRWGDAWSL